MLRNMFPSGAPPKPIGPFNSASLTLIGRSPRFDFDSCRFDPNRLGIDECVRPEEGELPAVATILDAANGDTGVRRSNPVNEDPAGVQLPRNLARQVDVLGPYIPAQSKLAGIGSLDGRV